MTTRTERNETAQLLARIETLIRELRSMEQRGGPDVDLKERELERLRWRLAAAVRADGAAA
jgi:uncharacterized coiled-coil DUF342 family protein